MKAAAIAAIAVFLLATAYVAVVIVFNQQEVRRER